MATMKGPLGLHKRMKMGMSPVMSGAGPGAMPMMKKGGKVCMKKGGHAKSGGHNIVKGMSAAHKLGGKIHRAPKKDHRDHVTGHKHGGHKKK